jgi:hypothetical protein
VIVRRLSNKHLVEVTSIGGIIAILLFSEFNFGFFSALSLALDQAIPQFKDFSLALVAAIWAGLAIYALRRRVELRKEKKARSSIEDLKRS